MGILATLKQTLATYVMPWGEFNLTPGTIADGDQAPLQVDPNGNLRTAEQFAPAAENNAAGVMYTLDKAVPTGDGGWTYSNSTSAGVGTGGVSIKGSSGRVRRILAVNASTTAGFYIQLHDKASAPSGGETPIARRWVPARDGTDKAAVNDTVMDFGPAGLYLANGIGLAASSTVGTLTVLGANDCHYTIEWI
ncbi:MAG TPA: hypothetical protein VHC45_15065 [Gaiellaceae bacterium]|nr:hypothetical protein [Gaiellaceae bacterium]